MNHRSVAITRERRRHRVLALAMVVATVLIASVWEGFDRRIRVRLTGGPMIQAVAPDAFTVVWRLYPRQKVVVEVVADDGHVTRQVEGRREGEHRNQFAALIDQLAPATGYRYRLVCHPPSRSREKPGKTRILAEGEARTAPPPGRAFRFLAFGDGGVGSRAAYALASRMGEYDPDLILYAGDLDSPDGAPEEFYIKFYRPYAHLVGRAPLYPCLGNHDSRTDRGQAVLDAFVLPHNGPEGTDPGRHYWFDYGDARFVAIDSNDDYPVFRDIVAPWLEAVLNTAGDRWKIVFFHEPVYTNGRYAPAEKLAMSLVPVFDRYGVALVLSGHDHGYQRTWPMRDGEVAADGGGTVYVVTAAGGSNLYKLKQPPPTYLAAWCDDQYSFTLVDVSRDALALRQIDTDGAVVDRCFIARVGGGGER